MENSENSEKFWKILNLCSDFFRIIQIFSEFFRIFQNFSEFFENDLQTFDSGHNKKILFRNIFWYFNFFSPQHLGHQRPPKASGERFQGYRWIQPYSLGIQRINPVLDVTATSPLLDVTATSHVLDVPPLALC